MDIKSKKLSAEEDSKIATGLTRKKSKQNESLSSTEEGTIFPAPKTKPSNNIDKAIVTLDEAEYNRLREIEHQVKELFFLARDHSALVGIGTPKKNTSAGECKPVKRLRELIG
jgi:hypothetical protein